MNKAFLIGAGVIAFAYFSLNDDGKEIIMKKYKKLTQRGIRNNNPGNIEYSQKNPWRGQIGSDGRFAIFDTPEHGIRAIARVLDTYRTKYGLNTISGIIGRWAPAAEKANPTAKYIEFVASSVGKSANSTITSADYPLLIASIIKQENGVQPYSETTIKQGIALA